MLMKTQDAGYILQKIQSDRKASGLHCLAIFLDLAVCFYFFRFC